MGDTKKTGATAVVPCEMGGCGELAVELHSEKVGAGGQSRVVDRRMFCAQHGRWQHLRRQAQLGRRGEGRETWWDVTSLVPAVAS